MPVALLAAFEAVGLAAEAITPAIIAAWEASVAGGMAATTAAAAAARLAATPVAKTGLKALLTSTPAKWIGGTAGAGLLFGAVGEMQNRAVHGSVEDQMRESINIQRKLEAEQQGMSGGGGGQGLDPQLEALLNQGSRTESSLLLDNEFSKNLANVAGSFKRATNATNPRSEELDALIKGNEAALMQLQSERTLTTPELIHMLESMDG